MQTHIDLAFADGVYTFRLGLAQINEIETSDAGLGAVFGRLLKGRYIISDSETIGAPADAQWRMRDIVETIRQGLIGGGKGVVDGLDVTVSALRANELIKNYVLGMPLSEAWTLAVAILSALIHGYEPPKKAAPAKAPAKRKSPSKASSAPKATAAPSSTAP